MRKNNRRALVILLIITTACAAAVNVAKQRQPNGARYRLTQDGTSESLDTEQHNSMSVVSVGNSLPRSFRNTQPNLLTDDSLLTPVFDTLSLEGRQLRVLHIGDSHVASGDFTAALRQTLQQAWGDRVAVSYLGKNGATAEQFSTPDWMQKIKAQRPDLIIASFGTNECHGLGYLEEQHHQQLQHFLQMLTAACPDAVILLTTPPGDYLATGRGRRRRPARPNPMVARCAAEISRFGNANHLAVWDLHTIAGGSSALNNYINAGLMQRDRIHFTAPGYTVMGHCLGEAILTAYNDYVKVHTPAKDPEQ